MKGSAIVVFLIGVGLLGAFVPRAVHAQTQRDIYSPFDKDDPEIQRLKKLDWKTADFEAQDLKTRCTALLALQNVLSMTGGKASARLDLLVDCVDQNRLGETFALQQVSIPPPPQISYEDAKKNATAFVTSDVGRDKFGPAGMSIFSSDSRSH